MLGCPGSLTETMCSWGMIKMFRRENNKMQWEPEPEVTPERWQPDPEPIRLEDYPQTHEGGVDFVRDIFKSMGGVVMPPAST